ncbi:major facilitator superfamily domain-containing protein [Aspergillus pseudonomiae]|uniref:Major facilitator superfamily domain-containing protein n=1 Tax=Aspergillus pseudonomiae TaxID=1506151 RepID=A0A5N6I757_9EURO|nr:major facilitator superfamily domain-containing protein [Aspergillus pseudonomiae]KAB8262034.1 major facilitator superfamily domain-containing protein [Aspergillus pseudonomiae]KAE8403780.1 major facilitator superfamily domain-containing protein [Aspergillus pseudonomiae]
MFIAAKYIHRKIKSRNQDPNKDTPKPVTEKKSCPHSRPFQVELRTRASGENPRTSQGTIPSTIEEDTVLVPQNLPKSDEKCQVCKKQKHDARVYRWKLIAGLCLPFILATLDLTIVATALPSIASHFNEFDELNWIVTAFTLTSTTFIPMFGQFADVFGRGETLHLSLFLMIIGSVLCAAAQTWGMLLLGRALQGVSDAGLMNVVMIILSDKVSLKESAKTKSLFTLVGGIGYAVGPLVGGYLTDANWRYCFVISIPIAVIAHILVFILLRNELVEGTMFKQGSRLSGILPALATVDIIGSILFIFGVGLIILATAWGGATYPWSAPQVIAPLVVGSACFVLFFVYEYFLEPGRIFARVFPKQVAMLPYSMFARRDTIWLAIVQFSTGAAMYSIFYYIGIYFSLVEAYPASKAGVQLLYYIPGMGVGVYIAVFLCNVWPAQSFFPLNIGTIISTVGLAMVVYAIHTQNTSLINGMMAITGAGTGLRFMPATLHMVGVWPEKIAPAQSLMRFAQPFGGTLCLTIMGSVFNNKFAQSSVVSGGAAGGDIDVHDTNSLAFIADLPADAQRSVRMAGKDAIMWAFIAVLPIMGLSLVTGLFIGNVWIKPKPKTDEEQRNALQDESSHSEVIYVPYLWALLKGNIDAYKKTNKILPESNSKSADFNNS